MYPEEEETSHHHLPQHRIQNHGQRHTLGLGGHSLQPRGHQDRPGAHGLDPHGLGTTLPPALRDMGA